MASRFQKVFLPTDGILTPRIRFISLMEPDTIVTLLFPPKKKNGGFINNKTDVLLT